MALVKVTTKYCLINALIEITSWFHRHRLITAKATTAHLNARHLSFIWMQ